MQALLLYIQRIRTPLQRACYNGCTSIVALLLEHNADVDRFALEVAVAEGYE